MSLSVIHEGREPRTDEGIALSPQPAFRAFRTAWVFALAADGQAHQAMPVPRLRVSGRRERVGDRGGVPRATSHGEASLHGGRLMRVSRLGWLCSSLAVAGLGWASAVHPQAAFVRRSLETTGETSTGYVALADMDLDGVTDIVSGLQWFHGRSWARYSLYPPDASSNIDIGKTVPHDVDGDGDLDLVANRRPQELFWLENAGPPYVGTWQKHHITHSVKYPELLEPVDIDGDGREEIVGSDDGEGYGLRVYEVPSDPRNAAAWSWQTVDSAPLHGLGIGDLNGDGRMDIVSDFVWFEQHPGPVWRKHSLPGPDPAQRGRLTMQIGVCDVDGDGDRDIILTRAHHYGAFWLESSGGREPEFVTHEILPGELPSQLHGVAYGDIDGDGDTDVFAGKCRYRHGDVGEDEPLDVFWLELLRGAEGVSWVKHQLATDLTMGFSPAIGDIDGDGDADLLMRGLGLGGAYAIGERQTQVTVFVQEGKP